MLVLQIIQQLRGIRQPLEQLPVLEGQLVGGAFQVVEQDIEVVGVDQRLLRRLPEEVLRVGDDVLVQRVGRRHHDQKRHAPPPPGAPGLLPGGGDGAGVAAQHAGVELADVDAQLQRVGGHHGGDAPRPQFPLDLTPLGGQVAAAIAPHPARVAQRVADHVLEVAREHLHREPGASEHDVLDARPEQVRGDVAGLWDGPRADAQLPVHHRGIVEHHVPLPRRRAVFVDQEHMTPGHLLSQRLRVSDGGRAADEGGMRAIEIADALQAPYDVGEVRPEHAPVGVDLVDHHVFQVLEQLHPLGVVGQYALVQHVRVGDHHVPRLPDGRPGGGGGVAVVGVGLDVRAGVLDHGVKLRHLVAGERLGGKQVECPGRLVLHDAVQHRHVVAQRLAAGRGGHHHEVPPHKRRLDGAALVDVGPVDPPVPKRADHPGVQGRREGPVDRFARGHHMPAGHVVHEEWIVFQF